MTIQDGHVASRIRNFNSLSSVSPKIDVPSPESTRAGARGNVFQKSSFVSFSPGTGEAARRLSPNSSERIRQRRGTTFLPSTADGSAKSGRGVIDDDSASEIKPSRMESTPTRFNAAPPSSTQGSPNAPCRPIAIHGRRETKAFAAPASHRRSQVWEHRPVIAATGESRPLTHKVGDHTEDPTPIPVSASRRAFVGRIASDSDKTIRDCEKRLEFLYHVMRRTAGVETSSLTDMDDAPPSPTASDVNREFFDRFRRLVDRIEGSSSAELHDGFFPPQSKSSRRTYVPSKPPLATSSPSRAVHAPKIDRHKDVAISKERNGLELPKSSQAGTQDSTASDRPVARSVRKLESDMKNQRSLAVTSTPHQSRPTHISGHDHNASSQELPPMEHKPSTPISSTTSEDLPPRSPSRKASRRQAQPTPSPRERPSSSSSSATLVRAGDFVSTRLPRKLFEILDGESRDEIDGELDDKLNSSAPWRTAVKNVLFAIERDLSAQRRILLHQTRVLEILNERIADLPESIFQQIPITSTGPLASCERPESPTDARKRDAPIKTPADPRETARKVGREFERPPRASVGPAEIGPEEQCSDESRTQLHLENVDPPEQGHLHPERARSIESMIDMIDANISNIRSALRGSGTTDASVSPEINQHPHLAVSETVQALLRRPSSPPPSRLYSSEPSLADLDVDAGHRLAVPPVGAISQQALLSLGNAGGAFVATPTASRDDLPARTQEGALNEYATDDTTVSRGDSLQGCIALGEPRSHVSQQIRPVSLAQFELAGCSTTRTAPLATSVEMPGDFPRTPGPLQSTSQASAQPRPNQRVESDALRDDALSYFPTGPSDTERRWPAPHDATGPATGSSRLTSPSRAVGRRGTV